MRVVRVPVVKVGAMRVAVGAPLVAVPMLVPAPRRGHCLMGVVVVAVVVSVPVGVLCRIVLALVRLTSLRLALVNLVTSSLLLLMFCRGLLHGVRNRELKLSVM